MYSLYYIIIILCIFYERSLTRDLSLNVLTPPTTVKNILVNNYIVIENIAGTFFKL